MPRKSAAVPAAAKGAARAKAAPAKAAKPAPKTPAKSTKPAVKAAAKAAAKSLAAPTPKRAPRKPAVAPAAVRDVPAAARPVLVRDSFTMPEQEYAVLAEVKQACLRAGIDVKKSELLRIGVALLGQVDIGTLKSVLAALPQLKTGRPPATP
ncbi:hypothetical protein [Massilia sp. LjRoot122]|uniref:hypothetical protein n=1 Tax=Massilia sp. LjRoot122 TaxID=3342257 RepID=UPI003ED15A4B